MISLFFAGVGIWALLTLWHLRKAQSLRSRMHFGIVSVSSLFISVLSLPGSYVFQKILGRLLMPAGLLWSAMFLATLWFLAQNRRQTAAVLGAAWLVLTVICSNFVGSHAIASLEAPYASTDVYAEAPFDAILVLGGGVNGSGRSAQLSESGDRPIVAARMYKRGLTPVLITSGSSIPGIKTQVDVAASTTVIWTDLGIPESAIVRVPAPKNTSEEMAELAKLIAKNDWKRVGVITSAFHMRRAMKLADSHGLKVVALPSDFKANTVYEGLLSWIPDAAGFMYLQKASWEYLGAAVGR